MTSDCRSRGSPPPELLSPIDSKENQLKQTKKEEEEREKAVRRVYV